MSNRHYLRRRHRLLRSFVVQMTMSGHSFRSLAPIVGTSENAMSEWGRTTSPRLELFDRAVSAIGGTLAIKRREDRT